MRILKYVLMNPEEVAGSAPASTPSSAGTSETTSPGAGFESPDFSSIVDSGYGDTSDVTQPSSAPASSAAPPSQPIPETPPATASAAVSPPVPASQPAASPGQTPMPAQPQQPPAAQTQPAPVQQPAVSSPPAASQTPAQGPFDLEALRTNTMPQLQELYTLSEQDAAEFEASPAKALPKLAAKLHFEATMAAYGSVMNALPQVVGTMVQQVLQAREQDQAFYTRWPQLKGQEDMVMRTLQAWKQVNPNATQQDLVERGGLMAMLALGLNPQPQAPAPQAPAAPTPPAPHRPAGPAGVGAFGGVFQQSDNLFEQIAAEHLNEMGLPGR